MEEAHKVLIYGNYMTAISSYTKLLESQPENHELYLCRAIAYIETAQYDAAIGDLEKSEKLKPENFQTHFRWGIALFYKQQFPSALTAFKTAEPLAKEEHEKISISAWIQKCLREQGTMSAAGLNSAATIPPSGKAGEMLMSEEAKKGKPDHEWYQSATYVNVTIKMKGCSKENLNVTFGTQEINLAVNAGDGKTYEYTYKLSMDIIPESCSYTVDDKKIEFKLKKLQDGVQWATLEKVAPKTEDRPSYPTSSKKKVDWDKLDKEITKETAKDKPEGDEALNNLFKAIYEYY